MRWCFSRYISGSYTAYVTYGKKTLSGQKTYTYDEITP